MRWIWIDRYIEFESGRSARAVKNLSLAEEHLHDHFPGYPVMPNSLIIEGIAQTGGLLVAEANAFQEKVILAKIPKAAFHFPAVAGDTLTYTTNIEYIKDVGAMISATSHVGDRLQGELEIVFAHLDERFSDQFVIVPEQFAFTLKMLGAYKVGRAADGSPLREPPGLADSPTASRRGGSFG